MSKQHHYLKILPEYYRAIERGDGTVSSYNYGPMTDAGEVIDNIVDSILFLVRYGYIDPKKL